jgi:hypothetical protein
MQILQLIRTQSNKYGTFGRLNGKYYTAELPWKDNHAELSCIPPGSYTTQWTQHPKHGWCFQVMNVPNRSDILIHVGNYAGDTTLGLRSDFEGCIGLGNDIGWLTPDPPFTEKQLAIEGSGPAVLAFNTAMNKQTFTLEVIDNIDYEAQDGQV